MDKLKIIIAGPGAGKTFNLKSEVLSCLHNLDINRFCAVITYTNAATSELKQRISSEIPIPQNVFIGTIHSFLIRFVIEPFGHLVGFMPMEKNYIEGPLVELHENYGHVTQKVLKTINGINSSDAKEIYEILNKRFLCCKGNINKNFRLNDEYFRINLPLKYASKENDIIKTIKENCIFNLRQRTSEIKRRSVNLAKKLSRNGLVSYDTVIDNSLRIISDYPSILNIISNRLQLIFIDEYQDSRVYIHQIFKKIISTNNSKFTVIGDPLQSVFNFTYLHSLIREESMTQPRSFSETPMMLYASMFRKGIDKILIENHRSSVEIVNFINEYITKSEQKQKTIHVDNGIPVYFIEKTNISEIFSTYKWLKAEHNIDNIHKNNLEKSNKIILKEFFLTRDWIDNEKSIKKRLKDVYNVLKGESVKLEKGNHRVNGILQEISRCVIAITGVKKQDFINSINDELEYRKFCFKIVRFLKSRDFDNYENLTNFLKKQFQEKFNILDNTGKQVDVKNSLIEFSNKTSISLSHNPESCYSSIHSAKGLEATSVLAIASSNKELEKWLNFKEANNNLDDDYRLGYVAFSRARDMLCISCLGEISPETKEKIVSLNIVFCSN